jgi:thioredoxin 1
MASEKLVNVTDASFEAEVLKAGKPTLIDFWASWCAPCKAIAPIVDELAAEYEGKIKVAKMNVDENPMTPSKFGVRGIPTLILFKDGKVLDQKVGAVPKAQLADMLKKAL